MSTDKNKIDPRPWWKFGMVWMVLSGPGVVVVAGLTTVWIAFTHPDPVIARDYYQQGININSTLAAEKAKSLMPAVQGRNHAATPDNALPPVSSPPASPAAGTTGTR